MKAVILAGGLGKRLRPKVSDQPKVMARVANKPFLEFHIRHLKKFGIDRIVCCVGYKAEQIMDYFETGKSWGVEIEYVVEKQPLGTAGAFKNAAIDEPFIGLNGDSFLQLDVSSLLHYFTSIQAAIIACHKIVDGREYGSIHFDNNQRIVKFCEKANNHISDWMNAGVYIITPDLMAMVPEGTPCSIEREIFPQYIRKGLYAFPSHDYFIDIGTPERYDQAQRDFLRINI